jgi:hypothetical protein
MFHSDTTQISSASNIVYRYNVTMVKSWFTAPQARIHNDPKSMMALSFLLLSIACGAADAGL